MTERPKMLAWALAYARNGYSIFPVHTPLFDAEGNCTGCTCEEYRRSDKCKENHPYLYLGPDGKCPQPGKCPRVKWSEKSTTDEAQIRKYWGWWPDAGIGIDMGKSRLLGVDADSYKDTYVGNLGDFDEETITSLTGGGGTHLWYRMPEGKHYGNATGELPAGIDIRGEGGYVVAPPSLHESGRRYQFELEYGPGEIDLAPLPQTLQDILDAAQRKTAATDVRFSTTDTERPDLSQWRLSDRIRELIHTVAPKGERSEADMSVITALCYAGATDNEILAVFEHYPIGLDGKYSERGQHYLAHTIGRARAFVEDNPHDLSASSPVELPEPDEDGIIYFKRSPEPEPEAKPVCPALTGTVTRSLGRMLIGAEGAQVLGRIKRCRNKEAYRDVLIQLVTQIAPAQEGWVFDIDTRTLGEKLNKSAMSANRNLHRLDESGILIYRHSPKKDCMRVDLQPLVADLWQSFLSVTDKRSKKTVTSTHDSTHVHETYAGAGHFADASARVPYSYAVKRTANDTVLQRALSLSTLTTLAYLDAVGTATRAELVDATGMTPGAAAGATRVLEQLHLVTVEWDGPGTPKVYTLRPDWEKRLQRLLPAMQTYGAKERRIIRNYDDRLRHIEFEQRKKPPPDKLHELRERHAKLTHARRRWVNYASKIGAYGRYVEVSPPW